MAYQTIISDLDGTLLMPDHRLGGFTLQTLRDLLDRGKHFLVATGRPLQDVRGIFRHLEIPDLLMITSNGARIDLLGGGNLYLNNLSNELTHEITNLAKDDSQVCVSVCDENGWFINVDVPELADFYQESGYGYTVVDFTNHQFSKVEKVFFLAYRSEHLRFLEDGLNALGDAVKWVYSTPTCLEVMNKNVSKAWALNHILTAEQLESSVAFGDGLNDLEMLQLVKKGLLMSNADPRLISKLPHLERIGFNSEEAVANYLRRICK